MRGRRRACAGRHRGAEAGRLSCRDGWQIQTFKADLTLQSSALQATAQYLVNLNVWQHNLLVLLGRRFRWRGARDARCSHDHARGAWAASSVFVIGYSYLVSMTVPYFSSLVGIVAGEWGQCFVAQGVGSGAGVEH